MRGPIAGWALEEVQGSVVKQACEQEGEIQSEGKQRRTRGFAYKASVRSCDDP